MAIRVIWFFFVIGAGWLMAGLIKKGWERVRTGFKGTFGRITELRFFLLVTEPRTKYIFEE